MTSARRLIGLASLAAGALLAPATSAQRPSHDGEGEVGHGAIAHSRAYAQRGDRDDRDSHSPSSRGEYGAPGSRSYPYANRESHEHYGNRRFDEHSDRRYFDEHGDRRYYERGDRDFDWGYGPAIVWIPGHYASELRPTWVPAHWESQWVQPVYETRINPLGVCIRVKVRDGYYHEVWCPGRYESRPQEVWVPGSWSAAF